jgi:serine/threonine protein phosphatase PrpC
MNTNIENIPQSVFTSIAEAVSQEVQPLKMCSEMSSEMSVETSVEMSRTMDSHVVQLGKAQDLLYSSQPNENEWILAVFDGHGNNTGYNPYTKRYEDHNLCLEALNHLIQENLDEQNVMEMHLKKDIFDENDNPALSLQKQLGKVCHSNGLCMTTGATMSLVKIRHDTVLKKIIVDVLSVGDSPVLIHCNGNKVFESVIHDYENSAEIERLKKEDRFFPGEKELFESNTFEILDETHITNVKGYYFNTKYIRLAMSQSLGHIQFNGLRVVDEKGVLGLEPFKARLEFDDSDDINIKLFSDGVSDIVVPSIIPNDAEFMKTSNARETVEYAVNRWKQNWKYCSKNAFLKLADKSTIKHHVYNFSEQKDADDTSCISWIQTMQPK